MIKFFINQHKAINLLFGVIIIAGVITFIEGRKEGFPNTGLDQINIRTAYPGASSEDIEELISREIEDAIENIEGKEKIRSISREGFSVVTFQMEEDKKVSTQDILDEIRSAVDLIDFPEDAESPTIKEIDYVSFIPNIVVGFIGQGNEEELKTLAKRFERDIKKIPDVSRVEFINYRDLEVWVEIDPLKLAKYDLSIGAVTQALRGRNLNIPAGTVKINNEEYLVKTRNEYETLDDIRSTVIRSNDRDVQIFLRDIATVKWAYEELTRYRRSLGGNGIWLNVFKELHGDAITVSNGVKELLREYEETGKLPPGIRTATTDDVAFYVERRLEVLILNATVGLLLVLLTLMLFLSFRITFWTVMGIPFSFCLGIMLAYAFGMTLNLITMFGLIIVLGMVVDDAIIIAENVYAYVEKGDSFYEAAIKGTKEMIVPVFAILATTSASFLPLITLPGIFGDLLGIIPKIVVITMACSFVECIFVLPGHLAYLQNKKPHTRLGKPPRPWFIGFANFYERVLTRIVRWPFITAILFLVGLLGLAGFVVSRVPFVFFPGEAESIVIDVKLEAGVGLKETEQVLDELERSIREIARDTPEINEIVSTVGRDSEPHDVPMYQRNIGFVRVFLDTQRQYTDAELVALLEQEVQALSSEIETYSLTVFNGGPPTEKPIDIYVVGAEIEDLIPASEGVLTFIKTLPNTTAASSSYEISAKEIVVRPNEEQAALLGVNLLSIGEAVSTAFGGLSTTELISMKNASGNDAEIGLVVKYIENKEETIDYIENTLIRNHRGFNVPLKHVSEVRVDLGTGQLVKEDGDLYISVSALLKDPISKDYSGGALIAMIEEQFPMWEETYPNVSFEVKGSQEEQDKLIRGIILALLLSAFGIYFVLTMIFRSYIQPIIVMSIIPLGFVGLLIGLFISGTPIGLMPFLGGIALMGVVVNDSLVMVDKINRLRRDEGMNILQAVIVGSKSRLRPILLTSITTIVGIAPLAYGVLGEEPFLAPMAISLLWGLVVASFLLLILLPVFYLVVEQSLVFLSELVQGEYFLRHRRKRD